VARIEGMHLTPLGGGDVLIEPGEGFDPTDPDLYAEPLLAWLQAQRALRLIYDLGNVVLLDQVYYAWLLRLERLCRLADVELVVVNMRPAAAFALARILREPPPFACALDVDRARARPPRRAAQARAAEAAARCQSAQPAKATDAAASSSQPSR